ncbi:MAG: NusG domain II-containing protein [Nitrospirota bacterium]
MNSERTNHKTTFGDGLLLLFFLCLSLYSFVFAREAMPEGSAVTIEVEGTLLYSLPLDRNTTVAVDGPLGKTLVEVRDRRVRVTESPCHNKLCLHQEWVTRGAVVCLPNRVVVTITAPKEKNTLDAITG